VNAWGFSQSLEDDLVQSIFSLPNTPVTALLCTHHHWLALTVKTVFHFSW